MDLARSLLSSMRDTWSGVRSVEVDFAESDLFKRFKGSVGEGEEEESLRRLAGWRKSIIVLEEAAIACSPSLCCCVLAGGRVANDRFDDGFVFTGNATKVMPLIFAVSLF